MNEEKSKMLKLTTDQIETKFGKGSIMKFGEGGHDLNIGVIPTARCRSTRRSASKRRAARRHRGGVRP